MSIELKSRYILNNARVRVVELVKSLSLEPTTDRRERRGTDMAEGYWVIRTYRAGMVGEKIKYWVPGKKPSKSQKQIKSDVKKQQSNEASAEKRVARLIHENFTPFDVLITLQYDSDGMRKLTEGIDADDPNELYHAAHHQMRLWLRRTLRACKSAGACLKYIGVTSDMDGKTGEAVRVHHHVIVNGAAAAIAMSKWNLGGTHKEALFDVVDQTSLAAYLLRQARRLPDEKKYIPSRNLHVPQPQDRIARNEAELNVPRGGQLLHRSEYKPGMPQYIRYILPEVGEIRRKRTEGAGKRE